MDIRNARALIDKIYSKLRKPVVKKAFVAVLSAGLITLLILDILIRNPVETSRKFIKNIQKNQPAKAYELFSEAGRAVTSYERFEVAVEQLDDIITGKAELSSKLRQDNPSSPIGAQTIYKVPGTDGNMYVVVIELQKQGWDWFVYDFEYSYEY